MKQHGISESGVTATLENIIDHITDIALQGQTPGELPPQIATEHLAYSAKKSLVKHFGLLDNGDIDVEGTSVHEYPS
jgi:hypothetical protein